MDIESRQIRGIADCRSSTSSGGINVQKDVVVKGSLL